MSLLEKLSKSIIEGDSEQAVLLAREVIAQNFNINEAIFKGLNEGMRIVGELYEKKEYFLPEIIISADALYEALQVLKPYMIKQELKPKAVIVIGVVRGDIHDIGKNITKILFEASGYKVFDCGRNVAPETYIEAIKKHKADVLALSTLMSPTLEGIEILITMLKQEGLQDKIKIIIGGAATSESFAKSIGVVHCDNAMKAIEILDKFFVRGVK